MRELAGDVSLLSINTATVRKRLALSAIVEACARRGIGALCPWRDQVQAASLAQFARQLKDARLVLTGYCRGGFFPAADAAGLRAALEDNRRAVDEAKALGAPCLVLVVGCPAGRARRQAVPHGHRARPRAGARRHRRDAGVCAGRRHAARYRAAAPHAGRGPGLYQHAGARARHLRRARPGRTGALGVALDVYHVWWDPKLAGQIVRAGRDRLLAYHVCDWLVPTRDLLNDRGMMGDGIIELKKLRALVEAAGYAGHAEVEIFSDSWWARPADEVLVTCVARY
jgi:sugar phosphate isomerase/epimerase